MSSVDVEIPKFIQDEGDVIRLAINFKIGLYPEVKEVGDSYELEFPVYAYRYNDFRENMYKLPDGSSFEIPDTYMPLENLMKDGDYNFKQILGWFPIKILKDETSTDLVENRDDPDEALIDAFEELVSDNLYTDKGSYSWNESRPRAKAEELHSIFLSKIRWFQGEGNFYDDWLKAVGGLTEKGERKWKGQIPTPKKPKKVKPVSQLTEERMKELPVAEPIAPPVAVATKVPDELSSKVVEYKSLAVIYKTKKAIYDTGKTKELKIELLQIKADIDKLLLEIKALKEGKEGKGIAKAELNGAGVYSLGQPVDKISEYDEVYKYSNPKKVQELAKKYLGDGGVIYRSIKKDKKYMVYNPNTKKWVHFGQMKYEDFTKHKDEKRRKNYLTRSANIKGDWKNDRYSPNNLSRNLLW
jgi:hypothetical protein